MLEIQKIGKRFGARLVIREINAQISPGECVAIVGRNGAGKSTLLRIVAGLTAPSRGQVRWNQASTSGQCAMFAPDAPLYRELSSLENLRFFAQNRASEAELRELLKAWALEKRANDLAGELSSGLRARLSLAVADFMVQQGAPILLLDEPTANMDDAGRALVENLVGQQQQRGGVVLLATNDARDWTMCGRQITVTEN